MGLLPEIGSLGSLPSRIVSGLHRLDQPSCFHDFLDGSACQTVGPVCSVRTRNVRVDPRPCHEIDRMQFAAALSDETSLSAACTAVVQAVLQEMGGTPIDLAVVFVSPQYGSALEEHLPQLVSRLQATVIIGTTAEAIIGGDRELEHQPALSLWVARLPGARLTPFRIEFEQTPDGVICLGIPDDLAEQAGEHRAILLLGDPFSSQPRALLERLQSDLPSVPIIGGLASGGGPGENRLLWNSELYTAGALAVLISNGPRIDAVVSQGARPVGQPMVITKAEQHLIYALGGKSPLKQLGELLPTLSERDQKLFEEGILLGIAMSEYREVFQRGDFLISGVLGADRETGALAVGNRVRVGQTVQFHLRDAEAAEEDLADLLTADRHQKNRPQAALLFSCNGRGTRMFATADHDACAVQSLLGPLPLAGMFAQGEIGPVGSQTYLHGFTASIALFRDATE